MSSLQLRVDRTALQTPDWTRCCIPGLAQLRAAVPRAELPVRHPRVRDGRAVAREPRSLRAGGRQLRRGVARRALAGTSHAFEAPVARIGVRVPARC